MSGSGASSKVKVAWITTAGVIGAALISAVALYLTRSSPAPPATSTKNVTVNVEPAVAPPAQPTLAPASAAVGNLPSGRCADVFSEPLILQQDIVGCVDPGVYVSIYCTAESTSVGGDSVWDLIYYRTSWGLTGYIPDYYVETGTDNAVMPSCVT